jgi:two-component system chemotaxis sensor kinase CheA
MAKDPYRYFRIEAQELLEALAHGLLLLDKQADPELLRVVLRHAHTFKGASRVVKRGDIGDLAHALEDLLAPHGDDGGVPKAAIDGALALLDRIRLLVASLGAAPKVATPKHEASPGHSIRVEVRDLDALLESASEALSAAAALRREAGRLGAHAIAEGAGRVHGEVDELRAIASQLRLVSAQSLMDDLEQVVRDAARALDKQVDVHARGAETHLDAHTLAGVGKALVHIVRNCVAHGIEAPDVRARAGKAVAGRIDVAFERRGQRVSISCRDDGAGLDVESVRRAALERGLISAEAAREMDARALTRVLFDSGVTTRRSVDDVSGRGLGLEAVRHMVTALGGDVRLDSDTGRGTTVEIVVPLSLSSLQALTIEVDDAALLIPLDSVRCTLRVAQHEISRDDQGERIVFEGAVIPFLPVRRALERPPRPRRPVESVAVIEAGGQLAAIGVDRFGAARSVVVRSIPAHAAVDPIIAGAAFADDGMPVLMLAPPVLIRCANDGHASGDEPSAPSTAPVLVIDDSLTTRMLEQSILESAGYEVDLAVSGEDGLIKARARRYGVFIVDVEMPGMNGFEFIETVQRDPELRDTPSILVTSRDDPKDIERGKRAGARAYIVKSAFDQADLLTSVGRLMR